MAQKKQPFRFRIPWLSGAHAARPATEPMSRRPIDGSKSPTQSDTNIPVQRPPPPPTQTEGVPRAEPQQQPPSSPPQPATPHPATSHPATSSVVIESPVTHLKPPSPLTTQTRVNSPLPSPSPSPLPSPPSPSPSPTTSSVVIESPVTPHLKPPSPLTTQTRVNSPLPSPSPSPLPSPPSPSPLPSPSPPSLSPLPSPPSPSPLPSPPSPSPLPSTSPPSPSPSPSTSPPSLSPLPLPSPPSPSSSPPSPSPSPSTSPPSLSPLPLPSPPSPSPSHAGSPFGVSYASSSPKTQPQSLSHLASGGAIEVPKPSAEENTRPASPAPNQEMEKMVVSKPVPQESEPKVKLPLKTIPSTPDTSFPAAEESTQPAPPAPKQEMEKMVVSEPMPQESEPKVKSPSKRIPRSPETSFPVAEESTWPAPPAPEQEMEKMVVSEPMPEESEPKVKSPLKTIPRSPSTRPAPPAPEQETEKMVVSEPMPQESEPKVKSTLKTTPRSPDTSFQPERMSTQPTSSDLRASSVPSSPVSKTDPPSQPHSPHSSSPLATERTSEVLNPTAEESTLTASSASQQEKGKMAAFEPVSQEPEPASEPLKTSSQAENLPTQPAGILRDKERSTTPKTKKMELDSAAGNSKTALETQSKFHPAEEKEKGVHEPIKVGKAKDTTTGQPIRRLHMTASASGRQTKDPFTRAFRADKKQQEVRETVGRKMMFATSNPSGKDIRIVSSADPEARNVSSISLAKPVSSNGVSAPLQKGIKDDVSKFVHKLATVHPTQPTEDTERPVSVITLAGDNKGATMHIGSESAKKEGSIHIHRAYKTDPEESSEVTTDLEENAEKGSQSSSKKDEVGKAYVNSNIQSINNSMMFHGSITERDPGVEVILPQQPAEPTKPSDKRGLETRKAEFNINRAEKSTYQTTIRRRCLRGLFLEPSDSDPDNPEKPRRHGCKFSCGENKKDKDNGVL